MSGTLSPLPDSLAAPIDCLLRFSVSCNTSSASQRPHFLGFAKHVKFIHKASKKSRLARVQAYSLARQVWHGLEGLASRLGGERAACMMCTSEGKYALLIPCQARLGRRAVVTPRTMASQNGGLPASCTAPNFRPLSVQFQSMATSSSVSTHKQFCCRSYVYSSRR